MRYVVSFKLFAFIIFAIIFSTRFVFTMDSSNIDSEALPDIPDVEISTDTSDEMSILEAPSTSTEETSGAEEFSPEQPSTGEETTEVAVAQAEESTAVIAPAVTTPTPAIKKTAVKSKSSKLRKTSQVRKTPVSRVVKKGTIARKPTKKGAVSKQRFTGGHLQAEDSEKLKTFSDSPSTVVANLINEMNSKSSFSLDDKMRYYSLISGIYQILGSEGYSTDEHYNAAIKLFDSATERKKFSNLMLNNIANWKIKTENRETATPKARRVTSPAQKTPSRRKAVALPKKGTSSRTIR